MSDTTDSWGQPPTDPNQPGQRWQPSSTPAGGGSGDQPTAPGQPGPGPADYQPPPPPPTYQAFGGEEPKRRKPLGIAAVVIGAAVLIGGGVFAATQLTGDEGSPEKAAEQLFTAFAEEDVLGMLEALPPSERDPLKDGVEDLAAELERLEILSEDLDLSSISGLEVDFEGLEFSSEPLADGFATVTLEAGTGSFNANPNELPLGSFVRDLAGESLEEAEPTSEEAEDLTEGGDNDFLVAIKEDGSWHISLWYSVAEAGRKGAGAEVPQFGNGLKANGADSPEEAVDQFIRAGAKLDVRRMIELLPPDEARALHDYAPLFIDDAEAAAGDVQGLFSIDIRTLEMEAETDGDEALVQVRKLEFEADIPEEGVHFSYVDGCVTFTAEFEEEQRICPSDFGSGGPDILGQTLGIDAPEIDIEQPELGFVTVERDGKWYISPTRTFLDNFVATLKVIDLEDRDAIRDFAEELANSGAFYEDDFSDDFSEDDFSDDFSDDNFSDDFGSDDFGSEDPSITVPD